MASAMMGTPSIARHEGLRARMSRPFSPACASKFGNRRVTMSMLEPRASQREAVSGYRSSSGRQDGGLWPAPNVGFSPAVSGLSYKHRSQKYDDIKVLCAAAQQTADTSPGNSGNAKVGLAVSCLLVVALGVANRVLSKMALVPMGNYVFFLSQLQCFGYVAVYGSILLHRVRSGAVSPGMLRCDKKPFVMIGLLEAVTALTQTSLAVGLPGALLPLLSQSSIMWQLLLSWLILGRKYGLQQIAGAAIVILGVVLAGLPPRGIPSGTIEAVRPLEVALYVASMGILSLNVLLKEKIFRDEKQRLGTDLDVFVVNSIGSAFQALFVFMCLPILTKLKGLSLAEMPGYVAEGFQCMMGQVPASGVDPTGAPLIPLLYIAVNLCFNISALFLLRSAGSVVTSLAVASILPLTVLSFSFTLPLLGQPAPLGPLFGAGFITLMIGLWVFNSANKAVSAKGSDE